MKKFENTHTMYIWARQRENIIQKWNFISFKSVGTELELSLMCMHIVSAYQIQKD